MTKESEEIIERVEKEKVENIKNGIAMAFEDYVEEKVKETTEKVAANTAIKLLRKGMDIETISEITELSIEDIKMLQIKEKKF